MRGGDEFSAYGVTLATGLLSISDFRNMFYGKPDVEYFTRGIKDPNFREKVQKLLEKWLDNSKNEGVDKEIYEIYNREGERWLESIQ
jgi:hypothetical protein